MKTFTQQFTGYRIHRGKKEEGFPATVPGCIQYDYAVSHGFPDVMFGEGSRAFEALEDDAWEYRATLRYTAGAGERVFFVSGGIDYQYEISLNGKVLFSHEGMYTPVSLDLTDALSGDGRDELCIFIFPHPKLAGEPISRSQAAHSCKPPVCYGWDWNPRLLVSGMWEDARIEVRDAAAIGACEVRASLSDDLSLGTVTVTAETDRPLHITLTDDEGNVVYTGEERIFTVKHPKLWWCNGQGAQTLYSYTVETESDRKEGQIGFRRIRLLRNAGAGDPPTFPKSRYDAPMTLELNGRRIFMQGSNWVNPELFPGRVTERRYEELIRYAKDAHFNIFRVWGGSGICKDSFYTLCDRYGILVWQEFMLACNRYPDDAQYLSVLEEEGRAVLLRLRSHPSLAFWCGGNELFNTWSGMDDQSLPLRLLNKLCYELDRERPFLATSPLVGVGHGCYVFRDESMGGDVFQSFAASHLVAYTEFGIPAMADTELLKKIIPEDELFPVRETAAWKMHHGFRAWGATRWICADLLRSYFGEPKTLDDMVAESGWLQSVGYQAAFEEMRRQWPHCSAAVNWCYDEPWITAANNSLFSYPAVPKPGYFATKRALRPVLFSARIPRFDWKAGDTFRAGIWLLNETQQEVHADVRVTLCIKEQTFPLLTWENATAPVAENTEGAQVCLVLPDVDAHEMILRLESDDAFSNEYRLLYRPAEKASEEKFLNM